MTAGSGRRASGHNAVAICERCSDKRLLRHLVYDGQFPDLLVCPDCWDPKHPQEYLPPVTDPVTIYDPTGDPDKAQNMVTIGWPPPPKTGDPDGFFVSPVVAPLQIAVAVAAARYQFSTGVGEAP